MPVHAVLVAVSAAIIGALGALHLWLTFVGPKLTPREPELQAHMSQVSPVITRQTTMWRAWVGFNASHSYGALLFGALYGYLAIAQEPLLFHSPFLATTGGLFLAGYLVLGKLYWFKVPFRGILLASLCYVLGFVAALAGVGSNPLREQARTALVDTQDDSHAEAAQAAMRHPYDEKLVDRLGCRGLLNSTYGDYVEEDEEWTPFTSDPWLECQSQYVALLLQEYKKALEKQDVERRERYDLSPIASAQFHELEETQRIWEDYVTRHCIEVVELIDRHGSGSGAVAHSNACRATETEERVETLSALIESAEDY